LVVVVLLGVFMASVGSDDSGTVTRGATETVPRSQQRWVWTNVNVRKGPSTSTDVVGSIGVGANVLVKNLKDGWWEAYYSNGTRMGYVANSVLKTEGLPDKVSAYTMAQQFVKDRLKSPRSAKFPWSSDEYRVAHTGRGKYQVVSYVDAQNAFGAMIRSTYVVEMQYLGNERWRATQVLIE